MTQRCLALVALFVGVVISAEPRSIHPIEDSSTSSEVLSVSLITSFGLDSAAVSQFIPAADAGTPSLAVTAYAAFSSDPVYLINDLDSVIKTHTAPSPVTLTSTLNWVNMVTPLSNETFGVPVLLTAGGFLVPGKTTGTITLLTLTNSSHPSVFTISPSKSDYFYHKAVLVDMDDDGLLDILAARATVPVVPWKSKEGEMVWFKQPAAGPWSAVWEEHILFQGPDISFVIEDFDKDGKLEIVSGQFFTSSDLVLYWCTESSWSKCGNSGTPIKSRILDSFGPYFDVKYEDVNNDGVVDLLVTNNRDDGQGALLVYEIPPGQSLFTSNWTRHVLASGFAPRVSTSPLAPRLTAAKGSPGSVKAFFPTTTPVNGTKPLLLLSGDDGAFASIFQATSQDPKNWKYEEIRFLNSTGTVGEPSIGDADGDGILEVFVPLYGEKKIDIYRIHLD